MYSLLLHIMYFDTNLQFYLIHESIIIFKKIHINISVQTQGKSVVFYVIKQISRTNFCDVIIKVSFPAKLLQLCSRSSLAKFHLIRNDCFWNLLIFPASRYISLLFSCNLNFRYITLLILLAYKLDTNWIKFIVVKIKIVSK